MPRRDENPAVTAAVLASLGIRQAAPVHAYSSPVATWIEGIPHAAPFLPAPAMWSEKRGAYYVDLRRNPLPAAPRLTLHTSTSTPSPDSLPPAPRTGRKRTPALAPVAAPSTRATAPKRAAANGRPSGWSEAAWAHQCAAVNAKTYDSLNPPALCARVQSTLDRAAVRQSEMFRAVLHADATDTARKLVAAGAAPGSIDWTEAPADATQDAPDLAAAA